MASIALKRPEQTRDRSKGALRDVGKALGLLEDLIRALSSQIWAWSAEGVTDAQIRELNLDPADRHIRLMMELAAQLKGLANAHAAALVAARADQPFASVDDLWCRAGVRVAALTRIAEADGFKPGLGLARRGALWAIRGLGETDLPLFAAAAAREGMTVPEADEPAIALRPMRRGREVVEDEHGPAQHRRNDRRKPDIACGCPGRASTRNG